MHPSTVEILQAAFFDRPTVTVARALVGKLLVHEHPSGQRLVGRVVETEAYTQDDPAFHGWGIMDHGTGLIRPEGRGYDLFGEPGIAYVYLCYGRYWLLNVVTEREGVGGAVLFRAVEPLEGFDLMWMHRPAAHTETDLASGPGKLTLAFEIDKRHHNRPLTEPPLYLATPAVEKPVRLATTTRIGITRGTEFPWRFYDADSAFVSPGVPSGGR